MEAVFNVEPLREEMRRVHGQNGLYSTQQTRYQLFDHIIRNMRLVMEFIFIGYAYWHETLCFHDIVFQKEQGGFDYLQIEYDGSYGQNVRLQDVMKTMNNRIKLKQHSHRDRPPNTRTFDELLLSQIYGNVDPKSQLSAYRRLLNALINIGQNIRSGEADNQITWLQGAGQVMIQQRCGMTGSVEQSSVMSKNAVTQITLRSGRMGRILGAGLPQIIRTFQCLLYMGDDTEFAQNNMTDGIVFMYAIQFLQIVKQKLQSFEIGRMDHMHDLMTFIQRQTRREIQIRNEDMIQKTEKGARFADNNQYFFKLTPWSVNMFAKPVSINENNLIATINNNMEMLKQFQCDDSAMMIQARQQQMQDLIREKRDQFNNFYNELRESFALRRILLDTVQRMCEQLRGIRNQDSGVVCQISFVIRNVKMGSVHNYIDRLINNLQSGEMNAKMQFRDLMLRIQNGGLARDDDFNRYQTVAIQHQFAIKNTLTNDGIQSIADAMHNKFYEHFSDVFYIYEGDDQELSDQQQSDARLYEEQDFDLNSNVNGFRGFKHRNKDLNIFDLLHSQVVQLRVKFRALFTDDEQVEVVVPQKGRQYQRQIVLQKEVIKKGQKESFYIDQNDIEHVLITQDMIDMMKWLALKFQREAPEIQYPNDEAIKELEDVVDKYMNTMKKLYFEVKNMEGYYLTFVDDAEDILILYNGFRKQYEQSKLPPPVKKPIAVAGQKRKMMHLEDESEGEAQEVELERKNKLLAQQLIEAGTLEPADYDDFEIQGKELYDYLKKAVDKLASRKKIKQKIPNGVMQRTLYVICTMYQILNPTLKQKQKTDCFDEVKSVIRRKYGIEMNGDKLDYQQLAGVQHSIRLFEVDLNHDTEVVKLTVYSNTDDESLQIDIIDLVDHIFVANKYVDFHILNLFAQNHRMWQRFGSQQLSYASFLKRSNTVDSQQAVYQYVIHSSNQITKNPDIQRFHLESKKDLMNKGCRNCLSLICNYDMETYVRNDLQRKTIQTGGDAHHDYCTAFMFQIDGPKGGQVYEEYSEICDNLNAYSPVVSLDEEQSCAEFFKVLRQAITMMDNRIECNCREKKDFDNKNTRRIRCYAFNGSKFDAHFILRQVRRQALKFEMIGSAGDIKELKTLDGRVTFRDSRSVTGVFGSLARIAKNLGLKNQKNPLDIGLYLTKEAVTQNIEDIKVYCQQDVQVDAELLTTINGALRNVMSSLKISQTKQDSIIRNSISLSQIALGVYREGGLKQMMIACSPERGDVLQMQRDSYRGGVTEALVVGHAIFDTTDPNQQFNCFDFNSLYPSIMQSIEILTNMGCQNIREFAEVQTLESIDQYIAFSRNELEHRKYKPGFDIRQSILELKPHNIQSMNDQHFPVLNFDSCAGDQDLYEITEFIQPQHMSIGLIGIKLPKECTLYPLTYDVDDFNTRYKQQSRGVIVMGFMIRSMFITNQLESISFRRVCATTVKDQNHVGYAFKDYIRNVYTRRIEAKKKGETVMAEVYKLLMNSLYGKFGQRDFGSTKIISQAQFDCDATLDAIVSEMIYEGGGLFDEDPVRRTITREELLARKRKATQSNNFKMNVIESLQDGMQELIQLSYSNDIKQHSRIGGLVLVASTVTAVAGFIEGSLMNITNSVTSDGAKGICLYGDTDSVFINDIAADIIKGKRKVNWFKGMHNLLRISDDGNMFDLKKETASDIKEMYVFGRKFYAYKVGEKWTNKCKGISDAKISQFQEMFTHGTHKQTQFRFVKQRGFVETHDRTIRNIIKLKQRVNVSQKTREFCQLKPFESVIQYANLYHAPHSCVMYRDGQWRVFVRELSADGQDVNFKIAPQL